ncbi:MAG TPA: SDR family oxidoreductase [Trueperaceae bacterium]
MKILITGTEGYLGSLLAPILMDRGHDVIGVDTGFYKEGWLFNGVDRTPLTLVKDLRRLELSDFEGVDAVVHMAELSNDPAGALAPDITYEINHKGSIHIAQLAKRAGVERFVYMSSCSVYGVAEGGEVDELSDVNPQTAYGICKTLVERDVMPMAGDDFSPTFLRNATAYGASPRMRFDIVLNNLAGWAWTTREIKMSSDGSPWRPLVHALDIAKAIRCALEAPRETVHGEIFNVGDSRHNYRVREIAEIVARVFPGCELSFGDNGGDNRSYRVNFEKINSQLPGFACEWDAERGARQLRAVFERIAMSAETFEWRGFTRLKALQHLIRTGQIDENFYWTEPERLEVAA